MASNEFVMLLLFTLTGAIKTSKFVTAMPFTQGPGMLLLTNLDKTDAGHCGNTAKQRSRDNARLPHSGSRRHSKLMCL